MTQLTSDSQAFPAPSADSRVHIVEHLWRWPGLSRIELAAMLGVDKSTMSRGVARLLESGLIVESAARDSGPQGGRRRIGLEIRGDWGLWLGLELQPDQCRGVLVDFAGDIRGDFLFDSDVNRLRLPDLIRRASGEARLQAGKAGVALRGAALAVPGPVRPGTGIVERSRPLDITEAFDLGGPAAGIFGLPVVIGNDVDWVCRGEMHFNGVGDVPNFLILFAEGRRRGLSLGLGIVLGGEVLRGDHGAAGEIMSIYRSNGSHQLALDHRMVSRAAVDPRALGEVSRELAPQVAMLANVMDIDRLVLGGLFRNQFEVVSPIFVEALGRRRTYPDLAAPDVIASARGDESAAYGAAIHFTENPSFQGYWRDI